MVSRGEGRKGSKTSVTRVLRSRENNVLTRDSFNMRIAVMPSCKGCISVSSPYFYLKKFVFLRLY